MKKNLWIMCSCAIFVLAFFPTLSHGEWKVLEGKPTDFKPDDNDDDYFDKLINRYVEEYGKLITEECLDAKETEYNNKVMDEREVILKEAEKENKKWDDEYFKLVSSIHAAKTRSQKFESLTTNKEQLVKLIERLKENITSIKEIYKNRLRAVPTPYLLLTEITGYTSKKGQNEIFKRLNTTAKEYLKTSTPAFITNKMEVKNLSIIEDIITVTKSGRIVSLGSDPVRQMSPSEEAEGEKFFLLQEYRIYPDFTEAYEISKEAKTTSMTTLPVNFKPLIIDNSANDSGYTDIPDEFKKNDNMKKLMQKFSDLTKFKEKQLNRLKKINFEYSKDIQPVRAKIKDHEKKLIDVQQELKESFKEENKAGLIHKIRVSEGKLNQHVSERVMILVTVPADHATKDTPTNDLFCELTKSAFKNLLDRARQLKTYKFFVVKNGNLKKTEAHSFYMNPVPIEFKIPLRRKRIFSTNEGYHRCSVVFGLKVKFSSEIPKESLPVPPTYERTNDFGMTFKYIESQTFEMGSSEDEPGRSNTEKQHTVTIENGFYMQETEVTRGQWEDVMGFGDKHSHRNNPGRKHPIEHVSWDDAEKFIKKLNGKGTERYRLPTEAEWEYACRAGTTTRFAFGNSLIGYANFDDGSKEKQSGTVPVKSYDPNAWGLYDMHGNVSEWCSDYYDEYTSGEILNPKGPTTSRSMTKVIRGGDFRDCDNNCRSTFRGKAIESYTTNSLGFRLVMIP